jgi:hypothetical protein
MKPTNTNTQDIERDIDKGNGVTSEQAADLAALQRAATDVDAAAPGQAVEAVEQGPDLASEIAGLMTVAVTTLKPMFPSLGRIYTAESIGAASGAIAGVCNKRGWLQGGMFGEWGEEIACVAVVGPLAIATYQGVKADIEGNQRKAIEHKDSQTLPVVDMTAKREADPLPSGKDVIIGAPVVEAA